MDLVAITDHDAIDGALTIADRPDVIVGCEVTASSRTTASACTSACSASPSAAPRDPAPAARRAASCCRTCGRSASSSVAQPRRLAHQRPDHRAAHRRADAVGRRHRGASTARGCRRRTAPRPASRTRAARSASPAATPTPAAASAAPGSRRRRRTHPRGVHGRRCTPVASRSADGRATTSRWPPTCCASRRLLPGPGDAARSSAAELAPARVRARRPARAAAVCLPLAGALAHFILEERFNQALLFDLVARPAMQAARRRPE